MCFLFPMCVYQCGIDDMVLCRVICSLLSNGYGKLSSPCASKQLSVKNFFGTGISKVSPQMADSILVANISGSHGTSPIILGLFEYFQRQTSDVGYFIPIAKPKSDLDTISARVDLVRAEFNLKDSPESMQGVLKSEAEDLLAKGKSDELSERIWTKFSAYKQGKSMVLLEGASITGLSNEVELNARLAADLDSPLLMVFDVMSDATMTALDILPRVQIAKTIATKKCHADIAGLILNRVPPTMIDFMSEGMKEAAKLKGCAFAGAIPSDYLLQSPRLNEIVTNLNARFLFGEEVDADVDVSQMMVAAQDVTHLFKKIEYLENKRKEDGLPPVRPLLLTTPDRTDLLLSLAAAHASLVGPNVAGVILCDMDKNELDSHVKVKN